MWPKAFLQLLEMAPQLMQVLPMADRFFKSKAQTEDAARQTMEELAAGVRGDLGALGTRHQVMAHAVEALGLQATAQAEATTVLAGEMRAQRDALAAAGESVADVAARLREMQARMAEMEARGEAVSRGLAGLESRLETTEAAAKSAALLAKVLLANMAVALLLFVVLVVRR